jgi:hypothetical protein
MQSPKLKGDERIIAETENDEIAIHLATVSCQTYTLPCIAIHKRME